jgi:hypothetical protein
LKKLQIQNKYHPGVPAHDCFLSLHNSISISVWHCRLIVPISGSRLFYYSSRWQTKCWKYEWRNKNLISGCFQLLHARHLLIWWKHSHPWRNNRSYEIVFL